MEGDKSTPTSMRPKYVESSFLCETFTCELIDTLVTFQILRMESSLYVWIGPTSNPVLCDLSLALPTMYEGVPVASNLLGSTDSTNMAKRLSKKFSIPVFVSYNLIPEDLMILPVVEKKLMEELRNRSHLTKES